MLTSFTNNSLEISEDTAGLFANTEICEGKSERKTAVGRQVRRVSSKKRVKSKARQDESTLGPNILSLPDGHIVEAITQECRGC